MQVLALYVDMPVQKDLCGSKPLVSTFSKSLHLQNLTLLPLWEVDTPRSKDKGMKMFVVVDGIENNTFCVCFCFFCFYSC